MQQGSRRHSLQLIRAAVIGALYFVFTTLFQALSFGPFQIRVSEILTVLPFFFPEAILGLTVGCLVSNFFSPFGLIDIIGGTLCTFIAAYGTYLFRFLSNKRAGAYLGILPPVIVNGLGVGFYISCISAGGWSLHSFQFSVYLAVAGSIMLGEILSAGIGGGILITYLLTKGKKLYSLQRNENQWRRIP